MLTAILSTLGIMGWLGIILVLLVIVNTLCSTVYNVCSKKESFSWKKMLKGLAKAGLFYLSCVFAAIAFTMLPFINEMITNAFGIILLSNDLLNTLSSVGVLGIVISVIVVQGKKAIEGITKLANVSSDVETITWEVVENEEETK